jgi:beta-galactosidase
LHTVHVELRAGDDVLDVVSEPLGLRWFEVTPDGGFFLNGHPLELRGVLKHQDRADQGWAVNDGQHAEDIALISEMGANAVRLVHYQQAPVVHDLCDRAGLLAWAELGLNNSILPTPAFAANTRQQLTELIRQNYNHPSIVLWGLGNEIVDFPAVSPTAFVAMLKDLAHAEDPTRLTTLASHLPESFPVSWQADLVGFNKYFGWYYGKTSDLGPWLDALHKAHPDRSLALSEFGAGASVRFHSATPRAGDHTEEYQAIYHEASWKVLSTRPYVWGKFITFMFDLASDGRNEGDTAGRNDKGLVSYDRTIKKDAFFWYKANWSSQPFVHINGRRFDPRSEATTDVVVYSNLPQVALTIDGQALGEKTSDDHRFVWPGVVLQPGANQVEATARQAGQSYRDAVTWTLIEPRDGGASDGGLPPGEGGGATLSGACTMIANLGPAVTLPSPAGPAPAMTGGALTDGTYVLTDVLNATSGMGSARITMKIGGGGTTFELVQRAATMPETTAAGNLVRDGNLMVQTLNCPGPATLVLAYTATPTSLQTLSAQGVLTTYTKL